MIYNFYDERTRKTVQVKGELWRWEAQYTDGTILKQFDDSTQIFHQISEIDTSKLFIFHMKCSAVTDGLSYSMIFNPITMTLIHFYRTTVSDAASQNSISTRLYCFGYSCTINGVNHEHINVILPNGNLITTDNVDKISII